MLLSHYAKEFDNIDAKINTSCQIMKHVQQFRRKFPQKKVDNMKMIGLQKAIRLNVR